MNILYLIAQVKVGSSDIGLKPVAAGDIVAIALNMAYFIAGVIAVIVIILSGYTFATAVYDPAKITQAKNAILYASVGLVVVIMAFVITQFILRRF